VFLKRKQQNKKNMIWVNNKLLLTDIFIPDQKKVQGLTGLLAWRRTT
jgi:response regulator of citrate/malate metabolism